MTRADFLPEKIHENIEEDERLLGITARAATRESRRSDGEENGFSFFASGRQFAVAARASAFELWI